MFHHLLDVDWGSGTLSCFNRAKVIEVVETTETNETNLIIAVI